MATPIIFPIVEDINATTIALTGDKSKLIKYHSNAYAKMEIHSNVALNDDMYIIRNGNETVYGYEGTFYNVESNEFKFSCEDSEGNVGTATHKATMVNYKKLTCNIEKCSIDGSGSAVLVCSGSFFNGSFGAKDNTLTVKFWLRSSTSDFGWRTITGTKNIKIEGNYYSVTAPASGLNYQDEYTVTFEISDKLSTVTAESKVNGVPLFHWGKDNFQFEVPVKFNSTEETNIKGDLRLKGSGNYGNTLYFGDSTCCYLKEETDDILTIYAKQINLTHNTSFPVQINGNNVYGSWMPTLYPSAVSSYDVRKGWYQRLGNVVTIGWQIKANIRSSYHTTTVEISGAPFVPAYAAFGGGVAYNLLVPTGFIFEGWALSPNSDGTAGIITARLQPSESNGNLTISSTSWYPSGGGQVTLAGTICFTTS
jgi:hypothetical protein